jgi:hypothetical protein
MGRVRSSRQRRARKRQHRAPRSPGAPRRRRAGSRPRPAPEPLAAVLVLFASTVLLSAFLLFQVQPIIGRFILPWFGASPGVWATCMLFFQALLLGGYAYAHLLVTRLSARQQAVLHALLLALALLTLPITPSPEWKPIDAAAPVGRILLLLARSVGVPYLLLSATGPLLLGWFARLHPRGTAYRLYAISNVGSLLALVSYPFLVERLLSLREQTTSWSLGLAIFALLCAGCAWRVFRTSDAVPARAMPEPAETQEARAAAADVILWLLLSACGSSLLLATTNQLCLDLAAVPLLWVLPLALYLLTFILCFESDRWYRRPFFFALLPPTLMYVIRALYYGVYLGLLEQVAGYSLTLFVGCMCCHGELARLRPPPRQLTGFFLVVAVGGVLGGFFVAIVAPAVFSGFYEYQLLLAVCPALVLAAVIRSALLPGWGTQRRVGLLSKLGWALCLAAISFGVLVTLNPATWVSENASTELTELFAAWHSDLLLAAIAPPLSLLAAEGLRRRERVSLRSWWTSRRRLAETAVLVLVSVGCACLVVSLVWQVRLSEMRYVTRDRNFYGALAIKEIDVPGLGRARVLHYGRILHGLQYVGHPDWPTAYYGPRSGVGLALRLHPRRSDATRPFRVGVVGLGAGTIAAYANAVIDPVRALEHYAGVRRNIAADVLRFYELNPMVLEWAEREFTFLARARERGADVETFLGDARIVMERQLDAGQEQAFDVLAIDAFTGDAVPVHLLTRESFEIYLGHLARDGILAIHASNRFLDLSPVVRRLAEELRMPAIFVVTPTDEALGVYQSTWALVTRSRRFLEAGEIRSARRITPGPGPLWTDEFTSVFQVLRLDR